MQGGWGGGVQHRQIKACTLPVLDVSWFCVNLTASRLIFRLPSFILRSDRLLDKPEWSGDPPAWRAPLQKVSALLWCLLSACHAPRPCAGRERPKWPPPSFYAGKTQAYLCASMKHREMIEKFTLEIKCGEEIRPCILPRWRNGESGWERRQKSAARRPRSRRKGRRGRQR